MTSNQEIAAIFCGKWYQNKYLKNDPYFDSPFQHYLRWGIPSRLAPNKWITNKKALDLLSEYNENDESMLLRMKVMEARNIGVFPEICDSMLELAPPIKWPKALNLTIKDFLLSPAKELQIDINICQAVMGLESNKTDLDRVLVADILNEYSEKSETPFWFEREFILECNPDLAGLDNESIVAYILQNLKSGRQLYKFDIISPKTFKCLQSLISSRKQKRKSRFNRINHSIKPGVAGIVIGTVLYKNPTHEIKRFFSTLLSAAKKSKKHQPKVQIEVCVKLNSKFNHADLQMIENIAKNFQEEGFTMKILNFTENLGFGGGHNEIAINHGKCQEDYLYLCINPDGSLFPTALLELCKAANKIGIHSGIFEALLIPKRHPKYFCPYSYKTAWASGACFAMSLKNYQLLQGFDERFFMYCEDVDISVRARLAGIQCYTIPDFSFWHDTTSRNDKNREAQMRLSAMELFKKYGLTEQYLQQLKLIKSIPIIDFSIDKRMLARRATANNNKRHSNHKFTHTDQFIIANLLIGDLHFSPSASNL